LHKNECKLLQNFKKNYAELEGEEPVQKADSMLISAGISSGQLNLGILRSGLLTMDAKRFINFVHRSRVCSICLRNDLEPKGNGGDLEWKCCSRCLFGWCCSAQHWDEYHEKHTPEICSKFQQNTEIALFHYNHTVNFGEIFRAQPMDALKEALPCFYKSWDEYFPARFAERYLCLPPPYFHASSHLLSQPLTCLHAMDLLDWKSFNRKISTLRIHVVGAEGYELPPTCVWEEILHCLPGVQELTVEFIGPEARKKKESPTQSMGCCPDCESKGRKRNFGVFSYTYHDFLAKYPTKMPDLIVAFNTGMHEVDTGSWKQSLRTMLGMGVPCYFTSFQETEAADGLEVLRQMNAKILHHGTNPFRDMHWLVDVPCKKTGIDKFYAINMYGTLIQEMNGENDG
jgi:hypothetical protein